ncbi:MAG: hypothetical protein Tsb0021_18140 [Chlamydiales bacterium]
MKFDQIKGFLKHVHDAFPAHREPVYMVLSRDPYDYDMVIKKFVQHTSSQCSFDGESLSSTQLMNELETIPFLSELHCVFVRRFDKIAAPVKEALQSYCLNPNPSVVLVLIGESLLSTTTLYKSVQKCGVILDLKQTTKPWEVEKQLAEWVREVLTAEKVRISSDAIAFLLAYCGADKSHLRHEIDKLITYVDERNEITMQDISALCAKIDKETLWQLLDAIVARHAGGALKALHSLLTQQEETIGILRQLRSHMQKGLHLCSLLKQGADSQQITNTYPYMKGTILKKNIQQCNGYGLQSFQEALIAIDATETELKNSSLNSTVLIEQLIFKLTL